MPSAERGLALESERALKALVTEQWGAKFSFVKGYPYRFLGVLAAYRGGTRSDSCRFLEDALAWFDGLADQTLCHQAPPVLMM